MPGKSCEAHGEIGKNMGNVSQCARVNNVEQCESVCVWTGVCVYSFVCVAGKGGNVAQPVSWPHVAQSIFDGRAKIYGEKYI